MKKIIAIALSVVILIGCFSIMGSAEEKKSLGNIMYIDEYGKEATLSEGRYSLVEDDTSCLSSGWWVVYKDTDANGLRVANSNVNLLILDNVSLNVTAPDRYQPAIDLTSWQANPSLSIYGQKEQSGIVNATTSTDNYYAASIGTGMYITPNRMAGGTITINIYGCKINSTSHNKPAIGNGSDSNCDFDLNITKNSKIEAKKTSDANLTSIDNDENLYESIKDFNVLSVECNTKSLDNHVWTYHWTDNTYECSKTVYYKCAICGEIKSVDIEYGSTDDAVKCGVVTISPHNIVEITETKATCISDGYSKGEKCSICGKIFKEPEKISDSLGHNYEDIVVQPTCKEPGFTIHMCKNCGEIYIDNIIDEKLDKFHNYIKTIIEPTCTEKGYTLYKCSVCGDSYIEDETEALGHTTYIKNYKEATNKEDGYSGDEYCSICGELIKEGNIIPKIEEEEDNSSNSFYSLFRRIILKIIEILTFLSKI